MGLLEHILGHLHSFVVLVLFLLCVVGVVGVLLFCCGGLKGHFGPLRERYVLVFSFLPEFFVAAEVVVYSLLRESEVL